MTIDIDSQNNPDLFGDEPKTGWNDPWNDPDYLRMVDGVRTFGGVVLSTGLAALAGAQIGQVVEDQILSPEIPVSTSDEALASQEANNIPEMTGAASLALLVGAAGWILRRRFLSKHYEKPKGFHSGLDLKY